MPNRLTLDELEVLGALLSERSLTRVSALLQISQPAVSKVLARLRRRFADPLFVRSGRGMEPTRRAIALERPIREVLLASRKLDLPLDEFHPQHSNRSFTLFMSDVGVIRLLPHVMRMLQAEAPHVSLHAIQTDPQRLHAKLEAGEVDLAVGPFPALAQTIRRQRLWMEGYRSVVRNGHPRLGPRPTLSAYRNERHIVVAPAGPHPHQAMEKAVQKALPPESIALRVPSFMAAAMVAKYTDLVATLPGRVAEMLAQEIGLQVIHPAIPLPRIPMGLCWHERSHTDAANKWLRSVFRRLFADY
jgi:DNA-binding transcriptional LysR family regulator